ncbi:MAG: four helix bundle protein [Patescibacteria group bacterium]
MAKERREIYSRINKVVLETLSFINKLPKTLVNIEISRQLVRSITSIGANANEAEGAASKKEA